MVYYHSSISVCNSVDQNAPISDSMALIESPTKSKPSNPPHRTRRLSNSSPNPKPSLCDRSRIEAVIDVVLFVAVIGACGFLLFPYARILCVKFVEIAWIVVYVMSEEVANAPLVYGSMMMSVLCVALAACALLACTSSRKCVNPRCRGLRKAAEFDIQLETEECVRGSGLIGKEGVMKKGVFELPRDHHRELEAELRKMAPTNGRAVLVFRARCGCSVGRLEVPGSTRKVKKIKK